MLPKNFYNKDGSVRKSYRLKFYKELREPIGTRRADFVVEDKVLVEIKAIKELDDVHLAQVLNYLKAYRLEVALLINFGSRSMQFKRLVL